MEHLRKCSSGPLGRACAHTRAGYSQTSLGTIASHIKWEQARLGAVLHFTAHMSIARLKALEERDEEDFKRHQHLQDNPPEDARALCPIHKAIRSRQHLQQWAPLCRPPRIVTPLNFARRVPAIWEPILQISLGNGCTRLSGQIQIIRSLGTPFQFLPFYWTKDAG